jgi:hypothetical protein
VRLRSAGRRVSEKFRNTMIGAQIESGRYLCTNVLVAICCMARYRTVTAGSFGSRSDRRRVGFNRGSLTGPKRTLIGVSCLLHSEPTRIVANRSRCVSIERWAQTCHSSTRRNAAASAASCVSFGEARTVQTVPQSHRPFTAVTGVRIPLGTPRYRRCTRSGST